MFDLFFFFFSSFPCQPLLKHLQPARLVGFRHCVSPTWFKPFKSTLLLLELHIHGISISNYHLYFNYRATFHKRTGLFFPRALFNSHALLLLKLSSADQFPVFNINLFVLSASCDALPASLGAPLASSSLQWYNQQPLTPTLQVLDGEIIIDSGGSTYLGVGVVCSLIVFPC